VSETARTRAENARRALDLVEAEPDDIRPLPSGPRPLSFQQERLWFLEQMEPVAPVYNVARVLRLDGPLSREALAHAVEAVIGRHDTLRTWIDGEPDEASQNVASDPPCPMTFENVEEIPEGEREAAARSRAEAEVRRPFDLRRPPLARAHLIRLAPARHLFVWTMHHIVSDARSLSILLRDLAAFYRSAVTGEPPRLPALAVRYGDYAAWQRATLTDERLSESLAYWRRRLSGVSPMLALPTDRPRPSRQTFRGGRVTKLIPAAELAPLKALGRRAGATLFMTLLAAFETLLSRYTGCADVVVGSPISGRTRAELEDVVGFFINMLVFRSDPSGDPTVVEFVARVRDQAFDAFDRQDLPFEKLVEGLRPERQMSHTPVFQVMFNFHGTAEPPPAMPRLSVEIEPIDTGTAQFDLTLIATEIPAGLSCAFVYNADLFDRATIERLAVHFETVLAEFGRSPDRRVSEVEMVPPEERRRLLEMSRSADGDVGESTTVPALLRSALDRDGARIESGDASSTARDLDGEAEKLARALAVLGVEPNARVGVLLDRSVRLPAAILGVWKAEAAFVAAEPDAPAARTAAIFEDAGVSVVVTERAHADAARGLRIVLMDELPPDDSRPLPDPPGAGPLSPAYVMYTSGSTGRPKGVVVEQRAVANLLESMRALPGIDTRDVWLSVTSPVFDISIAELFLPLIAGARLVIASRAEAGDPERLVRLIERSGTTVMQATPATWKMLVDHGWAGKADLRILSGGEALSWPLAEELRRRGKEVWNLYGPTETTIWSTRERLSTVSPTRFVPIGSPFAHTSLFVVDPGLRLVPLGVPGELAIGGAGVARGYLGFPEETAARFVSNPFGPGRIYRTGDRVRRLRDGRLEFLGRADDQVKVRGYRIEPAEIESALESHPSVRRAAVVAVGGGEKGESPSLTAFVVPENPDEKLPDLREYLRSRLPEPMVPSAVQVTARFPLTEGGKVDRRALAMIPPAARRTEVVAPRTEAEELVARTWQDVLRIDRVGIEENFFDLGGHSLLATRILARLRKIFSIELPLRLFFEKPTVAGLAAEIARRAVPEPAGSERP